ncbi:MAG: hypothetical protein AB7F35_21360, partial [Acetobacteraceae bacterium]
MPSSLCVSVVCLLLLLLTGCATSAMDTGPGAAQRFAEVSGSPPLLRAFLYRMPKGGDLHVHLSGAAYAEPNLRAGAAAGRCANLNSGQVSQPPCAKGTDNLAKMVDKADPVRALVDAWSMRNFVPSSGYSGHDHFFGTFSRFGGVADPPDMAAEVIDRAGRQR